MGKKLCYNVHNMIALVLMCVIVWYPYWYSTYLVHNFWICNLSLRLPLLIKGCYTTRVFFLKSSCLHPIFGPLFTVSPLWARDMYLKKIWNLLHHPDTYYFTFWKKIQLWICQFSQNDEYAQKLSISILWLYYILKT
jgi:hypothetical protein